MNCLKCTKKLSPKEAKHGFHLDCFKTEFGIGDDLDFLDLTPRESDSTPIQNDSWQSKIAISFFHGAFKKYSSRLGENRYILKVQEKDYPELPHIEYISNAIGELLGIEVPEYHYILYNNEIPTFVTRNFLDFHSGGNLIHIWRYLSKKKKDSFDCETLLRIILGETGRPLDQKKFIEICLFDMIIGNHDRHGRNLGILQTKKRKVLSPCYDNPSYIGIEIDMMLGADIAPKGKIFTKESSEPNIVDYINEFKRLGFDDVVTNFLKKIDKDKIKTVLSIVPISSKRCKAFWKLVEANIRLAKNENR